MATIGTNALVRGFSGLFGNALVFKTVRGRTFVSAPASKPDKRKESAAQQNTRSTFRNAAFWAQTILEDPEKKAYYQQRAKELKVPNAYTAAITDYMRKPKVATRQQGDTVMHAVHKAGFSIRDVQVTTTDGSTPEVKKQKNETWTVTYKQRPGETLVTELVITDNLGRVVRYPVKIPLGDQR